MAKFIVSCIMQVHSWTTNQTLNLLPLDKVSIPGPNGLSHMTWSHGKINNSTFEVMAMDEAVLISLGCCQAGTKIGTNLTIISCSLKKSHTYFFLATFWLSFHIADTFLSLSLKRRRRDTYLFEIFPPNSPMTRCLNVLSLDVYSLPFDSLNT